MSDDRELVGRLAAIDATPRASWVAELRADLAAAWEAGDAGGLDSLRTTRPTVVDHEPTPPEPSRGRRWVILAAAAAAVVAIALLASRDGEVAPGDQPSPTLTVAPTVPPTVPPEPWSSELTAQLLSPPISCDISTENRCPSLAVSPDGTLVAHDMVARTLTWYEDEPRVVPLTAELGPSTLMEIGPHDVAYFHARGNKIVAVAPSGVEITSTRGSNAGVYPTASGVVQFHSGVYSGCLTATAAPPIPWVDLDGNPITDTTRSFPTATATDAGIEIRLGERKWVLADREAGRTPGRLDCLNFLPRSDGGVAIAVDTSAGPSDAWRVTVFELLPDGTIERYFFDRQVPKVLPDGSMIVEHDHQLIHLTPPA